MNTIKLNIGLENNLYSFEEVHKIIPRYISYLNYTYRQQTGEYNGEPERTFVASFEHGASDKIILDIVEYLTTIFTQDCIAVKINDVGHLVYNPEYTGEKFEFNNEYFIEP